MDIIKEFVKPELVVMIPVLYLIGVALKNTLLIKDNFIPLTLGLMGIILAVVYTLATVTITNYQDGLMAAFIAITQGILCAGCSVYFNQVFVVQPKKGE